MSLLLLLPTVATMLAGAGQHSRTHCLVASRSRAASGCLESHPVLPRHIAVIPDGNARWAARERKERIEGHWAGVAALVRYGG